MVDGLDQNQIERRVIRMVAIDVMDVKPFAEHISQPFLGSIWMGRQPRPMMGLKFLSSHSHNHFAI